MAVSPFLTKCVLGLGGITVTAAGAAYAGGAFSSFKEKELISKLIKTSNPDKREITTTTGTDALWKAAWKMYRYDNKDKNPGEDVWKLNDWKKPDNETINNDVEAPTSFINECKSQLSKKTFGIESDLYKEVLRYCTRDTLVKDLITENISGTGKQLLQDGDTSGWNAAWQQYLNDNKVKEKDKDKWKLSDWGSNSVSGTISANFKSTCSSKSTSKAYSVDNEDYKDVVSWCTK
ncbi:hypothetical protein MHC_01250 [Mycoplasma haemocanis str. Illinois]|uniref:Uncharacterized protein n=1 Tax=Mycoplasma haemocanis (strain Illinois) TaxID=1111676 RepID=H6N644_MYCHN|nr:hypothetical protein [Mycoplasma haemocanis]AEW45116.1 hypothetical protein MHC_01250 [Mycoplasma haemocanis str. Illinois]